MSSCFIVTVVTPNAIASYLSADIIFGSFGSNSYFAFVFLFEILILLPTESISPIPIDIFLSSIAINGSSERFTVIVPIVRTGFLLNCSVTVTLHDLFPVLFKSDCVLGEEYF